MQRAKGDIIFSAGRSFIGSFAVVLLIGAGIPAGFIFWAELDRTKTLLSETEAALAVARSELDATRHALGESQTTLDVTTSALRESSADLEGEQALNVRLAEENISLQNESARLASSLAVLQDRHSSLLQTADVNKTLLEDTRAELQVTKSILKETGDTLADTQNTLADTQDTLVRNNNALETQTTLNARLDMENDDLRHEYQGLQNRLETLTSQYDDLTAQAGTKEQLEAQAEELRIEIGRLEQMRQPLILDPGDSVRSGFLCTGSMEPVISCLDEAIWLTDFRPEDIVVGTTIAFAPSCSGGSAGAAHRVMQIEVRNGKYYYWPKGDNNREPDGCWVPEENIKRYITKIHLGTRPENADLRKHVNDAVGAYYDLLDIHCKGVSPSACIVGAPVRSQISQAASAAYCWVRVAKESDYPGHIPQNTCD